LDTSKTNLHETIFATCRRTLGSRTWGRVLAATVDDPTPSSFPQTLPSLITALDLPPYITDLARLEWMLHEKKTQHDACRRPHRSVIANSTLSLLPVDWKHLAELIRSDPPPWRRFTHRPT